MFKLPNLIDCNLAVIGLGYVGLPLALEFANRKYSCINKKILKRNIIGFDISEKRIRELKKGNDLFFAFLKKRLSFCKITLDLDIS